MSTVTRRSSANDEAMGRENVIAVMERDCLDYRDVRKHITVVGEKPEATVVIGCDATTPNTGPAAGKR